MKKLALLSAFITGAVFLTTLSHAAEKDQEKPISSIHVFRGLDVDDAPLTLQEGLSQDSQNVLTDQFNGLAPRFGFISYSTQPANNMWEMPTVSGTRYFVKLASNTLTADTGAGTFSTLIGTMSSTVPLACSPFGQYLYCTNTVDGLFRWDSTNLTFTLVASTMNGTQVVTWKGRLCLSGVPGNERLIYLSKYLDGTTWNTPAVPVDTDPQQITVQGTLDEPITTLYSNFYDMLMWFTPHAFGGILGSRQSNFSLRTFNDRYGTAYPDSVQDCDGFLRFLGPQQSYYEFDGSSMKKISGPHQIDALMATVQQGNGIQRTLSINTNAAFSLGTSTNTQVFQNSVILSTNNVNLVNNSFETRVACVPSSWTVTGWNMGGSGCTTVTTNNCGPSWTASDGSYFMATLPATQSYSVTAKVVDDGTAQIYATNSFAFASNRCTWLTSGAGVLTPGANAGKAVHLTFDDGLGDTVVSNPFIWTGDITFDYKSDVGASSDPFGIDNVKNGANNISIGTYTTTTINTIGGSSFGAFNAGTTLSGSGDAIAFGLYVGTTSIITPATLSSWTSSQTITNGSIPSIKISSYAAITNVFTVNTTTFSENPTLTSLTLRWNNGSVLAVPSAWSNQRLWEFVSIASTQNNTALIYDRNHEWQKFTNMNCVSARLYNSNLMCGTNNGIFQMESGNSDNGTAINAYYTTRRLDLTPQSVGLEHYANLKWLFASTAFSNSTLQTQFDVNGWTANQINLGSQAMNQAPGDQSLNIPFSAGNVLQARDLDIKFTVSSTNFWNIFSVNCYGSIETRPSP